MKSKQAISAPKTFYVAISTYRTKQALTSLMSSNKLVGIKGVSQDKDGILEFIADGGMLLEMPGTAFLRDNPEAKPVQYEEDSLLADNMKLYVRVRQTGSQPRAIVAIFYSWLEAKIDDWTNEQGFSLDTTPIRMKRSIHNWLEKNYVKDSSKLGTVNNRQELVAEIQSLLNSFQTLIENNKKWYENFDFIWEDILLEGVMDGEAAVDYSLSGTESFESEREWITEVDELVVPSGTVIRVRCSEASKKEPNQEELESSPYYKEAKALADTGKYEVILIGGLGWNLNTADYINLSEDGGKAASFVSKLLGQDKQARPEKIPSELTYYDIWDKWFPNKSYEKSQILHDFLRRNADHFEIKTIPISSLTLTENMVDFDPSVPETYKPVPDKSDKPIVLELDSKNLVVDGHHKIVKAFKAGETDIECYFLRTNWEELGKIGLEKYKPVTLTSKLLNK